MCVWLGGVVRWLCSVRVLPLVSAGGSSFGLDVSVFGCARDVVCIACVAGYDMFVISFNILIASCFFCLTICFFLFH